MALPKNDAFTAADQDLSTYNANWVDMYATTGLSDRLRIVSNHVEAGAGFNNAISYWAGDTFAGDHYAQAVIGGATSLNYAGLVVRASGTQAESNNGGYLWLPSLGLVFTIDAPGPSFSQIASGWATPSASDTIKFEAIGTQLTGYINGTPAGTVSDATFGSGSPGMCISGALAATLDDFVGNNVSGGGTASYAVFPRWRSAPR